MHTVLIGCTGISAKLSKPQSSKYDVMLKTTRRRSWERISLPNELLGSHALATTPLFETFLKCHVGTVPGHTFGKFGVRIAFGILTDRSAAHRHRHSRETSDENNISVVHSSVQLAKKIIT